MLVDWRCVSSSRALALQAQSHEFKPQSHQKRKTQVMLMLKEKVPPTHNHRIEIITDNTLLSSKRTASPWFAGSWSLLRGTAPHAHLSQVWHWPQSAKTPGCFSFTEERYCANQVNWGEPKRFCKFCCFSVMGLHWNGGGTDKRNEEILNPQKNSAFPFIQVLKSWFLKWPNP
jgi:hypothetical protein